MKKLLSSLAIILATAFISSAWAEEEAQDKAAEESIGKEGTDYIAFHTQIFTFQSINGNEDARTYGNEIVLGTYITDYILTEGRAGWGYGMADATVGLEVGLNYWFSWYMGLAYPITDFMSVHAKYGISHVNGDTSREDPKKFKDIPEDFLQSSFSTSWVIGSDVLITKGLYGTVEYGRRHNDTKTQIEFYHFGMGLTYEF